MEESFNKVVAVAVTLIVGVYVVAAIFGTMPAFALTTVTNESVTVDYGNSTQVDETWGENYLENETVYNSNGAELTEGTDYEWYTSNQSVYWYNTSNTTDGANASITYSFEHKPDAARQSIGTIGSAFTLGAVAIIVLVASLILAMVAGFGANSRGRRR